MKNILVTGGCGFIGSNFILSLLRDESILRVINLDKLSYAANPSNLEVLEGYDRYQLVKGDIGNEDLVRRLLREYHPDAILNFAAESHVDRSIHTPHIFIETNIVGAFNLFETTRDYWQTLDDEEKKIFKFLHISTDEVYGSLQPEASPFTESTPYAPNSPYAASKASSDHLARSFYHTYGFPIITTHCSNNYGPYQFPEKLIPLAISHALEGKPIPIYGDGLNVRDWIHVEDHCNALKLVLQKGQPGQTYNIGSRDEKTNLEIVKKICSILDRLLPDSPYKPHFGLLTHVKDRLGHDRRYAIDPTKIEVELGWSPHYSFEEGILQTVKWYLDNQDWVRRAQDHRFQEWIQRNYAYST